MDDSRRFYVCRIREIDVMALTWWYKYRIIVYPKPYMFNISSYNTNVQNKTCI